VNFLLYTKSLSRKENLTENLYDLLFSFRRPAHSEAPTGGSSGVGNRLVELCATMKASVCYRIAKLGEQYETFCSICKFENRKKHQH